MDKKTITCARNYGQGDWAQIAAAEHGNLRAVKFLPEPGQEIGDLDLEELKKYGSYDHKKRDDQGTASYKAAAEGHSEIFDILLEKMVHPSFKDTKGRSSVDVAEAKRRSNIAQKVKRPTNLRSSPVVRYPPTLHYSLTHSGRKHL